MNIRITLLFLVVYMASCTHAPKKSAEDPSPFTSNTSLKSPASPHHIEISYILGHNLYQYISDANEREITLKFSLNHQAVNQRVISNMKSYSTWSSKVQEFIVSRSPASADLSGCRSPYHVTLREGEKANITKGCRMGAEGTTLSRIAREADFLLYSLK